LDGFKQAFKSKNRQTDLEHTTSERFRHVKEATQKNSVNMVFCGFGVLYFARTDAISDHIIQRSNVGMKFLISACCITILDVEIMYLALVPQI